jgi:two-component system, LuxR family, sensor kinase FixL
MAHPLTWLTAAVFGVITLVTVARSVVNRGTARTSSLAAGAFGSFCLILTFTLVSSDLPHRVWTVLAHGLVALLILFPWLLYRFATVFRPTARWLTRLGDALTVAVLAGSVFLSLSPTPQQRARTVFELWFTGAFFVQWLLLLSGAGALLWAAGRRCPASVQARMRLLSVGAVTLGLALLVSAIVPAGGDGGASSVPLAFCLLGGSLFYVGFATPRWLSDRLDGPSDDAWVVMTRAIIEAEDTDQLWSAFLTVAMKQAGATAGTVVDDAGIVVRSQGSDAGDRDAAGLAHEGSAPAQLAVGSHRVHLRVRSSAAYFREAEHRRLDTLCALAALALQRLSLEAAQRARATRQLRESRNLAETILSSAADAILTVDGRGTVATANPAAGSLFAVPRELLVGTPFSRWIPDLPAVLGTGTAGPAVHQLSTRDAHGNDRTAELTVSDMSTDGEHLTLYVLRDITERKQSEQALRDGAARLDAIVGTAVDGILTIDERGVIETVNRAAEELFGYTAAEMIGRNVSVLMPEPTRAEHDSYLRSYIDTGERKVIGIGREVVGRRKDGTLVDLELGVSEMRVGHRRMFTGILRDITERKLGETVMAERTQALARSNAELQQFAYIASHDLQEPLRKVASYVQVLAADYCEQLDDEAKEYIGFAVDGAQRMRRLIDDLLAVSRVRTEAMRIHQCDLGSIVESVLEDFNLAILEANAEIVYGDLPPVLGDETHLRQLFQNLISNSIKYRAQRPLVLHLGARPEGELCWFTVSDNGIGFKQQYADKVFGMFQRLVSRNEYPGTGIGLAICAKVVENHGGTITVESEPGVGTTFRFSLPLARELARA